jgi:hypothetical protein
MRERFHIFLIFLKLERNPPSPCKLDWQAGTWLRRREFLVLCPGNLVGLMLPITMVGEKGEVTPIKTVGSQNKMVGFECI